MASTRKKLMNRKEKKSHVVVRKHHSKPYRKRHVGILIAFIALAVVFFSYFFIYRQAFISATKDARNFVISLFDTSSKSSKIVSTYGFSIDYDPNKYYAGAVDSMSGNLYFGSELTEKRTYEQVRFSSSKIGRVVGQSSMTINYLTSTNVSSADDESLKDLETELVLGDSKQNDSELVKVNQQYLLIDDVSFVKTEWQINTKLLESQLFTVKITTYRGVVNSKAMLIKIAKGVSDEAEYTEIIGGLKFGKITTSSPTGSRLDYKHINTSSGLLSSFNFASIAKAQSASVDSTELVAAKYGPAVVRIYNLYCMDINFDSKPYLINSCSAVSGSGFFIGSNGYIATNGHVVNSNPKDVVINEAWYQYFLGNTRLLDDLLLAANIKESEVSGFKTVEEAIDYVVDRFYGIDDTRILATNNISNLLVLLNERSPNLNEVWELTNNRKQYTDQGSIKNAIIVTMDYRVYDGIARWRASDVAIIKINGSNYPVVKTGSAAAVTQGSTLTILGYPAQATSNQIIEKSDNKVTLTSGRVSAIKNAKGSDKKLIETDTTIGHGNSGGPAFDSNGLVIGLATYTSDGAGKGYGTFNYIRDIKDLLDIASSASVELVTSSTTQEMWEEGLDYFYKARYTKAIEKFNEVKGIFPQHSKADELISSASERINLGQDLKDIPYNFFGYGVAGSLLGISVIIFIIRRHHFKHRIYTEHITDSGAESPFSDKSVKKYRIDTRAKSQDNINESGYDNDSSETDDSA